MRPLVIAHRQLLLVRHVQVRKPGPCRFSCAELARRLMDRLPRSQVAARSLA